MNAGRALEMLFHANGVYPFQAPKPRNDYTIGLPPQGFDKLNEIAGHEAGRAI